MGIRATMIKGGGIQRGIVGRSWKTIVACEKRVTKVTQLVERPPPAFAEDIDPVLHQELLQTPKAPRGNDVWFVIPTARAHRSCKICHYSRVPRC